MCHRVHVYVYVHTIPGCLNAAHGRWRKILEWELARQTQERKGGDASAVVSAAQRRAEVRLCDLPAACVCPLSLPHVCGWPACWRRRVRPRATGT